MSSSDSTNTSNEISNEYWIVRHGERFDHKHPFLFHLTNLSVKHRDAWLTDSGRREAAAFGDQLVIDTTGAPPEAIVSSPYLRCIQTAHAIQQAFAAVGKEVPLIIETKISEFQPIVPESCYLYPDGIPGFSGREEATQMIQRSRDAINNIKSRYKRAVIISHANIVYHMALGALNLTVPFSYRAEFGRSSQVGYLGYVHITGKISNNNSGALELKTTSIRQLGKW